jgi:hypothetical protein
MKKKTEKAKINVEKFTVCKKAQKERHKERRRNLIFKHCGILENATMNKGLLNSLN